MADTLGCGMFCKGKLNVFGTPMVTKSPALRAELFYGYSKYIV